MVKFDDSQRAFIQSSEGNIRLLAPAGCGKTLCLLYRCKHLAERTQPRRNQFLIVTFTRAAREELGARIAEDRELAGIRDRIEITTLNSWGYRRIRSLVSRHELLTSKDQFHFAMWNLLRPVWNRQEHEQVREAIQKKSNYAPKKLLEMIDTFKSMGFDHVRHESFIDFRDHWNKLERQGLERHLERQIDRLIEIEVLEENKVHQHSSERSRQVFEAFYGFWRKATVHLIDSATFTLDDQKYFAYQDERTNIEQRRLRSGAASYDHVFVDEFQDINPLDLALVRAIVERSRATLTIAGDDDQAIFEWRGATPDYILNPSQFFDRQLKTCILKVNYRSPSNIVEHSQRLIANNQRRVRKPISSYSSRQAKIEIRKTRTLTEALDYVHDLVSSSVARGEKPSRIALIGRLQYQIIPYQVFFASKEIPFSAAEDLNLFLSETFDRLLRLLEIRARGNGRQRTHQVVTDILFLCDYVKRYPLSKKRDSPALRKWLQDSRPKSMMDGIHSLAEYRGELKRSNSEGKISINMADAIRKFVDSEAVSDALLSLSDNFAGLQKDFVKAEEDFFFKDPPFLHLADYANRYGTNYDDFVEDIELAKATLVRVPPIDEDDDVEDLSKHPLHLMTATRAKGKEFDKVVLLDVQDGIWPNKNARTTKELEAERRVFYVAFTRAREQVTLLTQNTSPVSPYIQELGL